MEWSIIVFCYNEAATIAQVVYDTTKVLQSISNDFEILLVNDGSTDGTSTICETLAASNSYVKIFSHPTNKGIGAALKTGYNNAIKKHICAIPGDGQFNINLLKKIHTLDENTFYSFYRTKTNYNIYRTLLTFGNRTFNLLFLELNLKDVNWIKVYTREQLNRVDMKLTSSLIETEICAKLLLLEVKVIELPSEYIERRGGSAKGGSIKTLSQVLKELLKLTLEIYCFKKKCNTTF